MARKHIGIAAGALLVAGLAGFWGFKFYIKNNAKSLIQQWVSQTGRVAEFSYQGMDVGLFSKTVQLQHVSLLFKDTNLPVDIDRFILYSYDTNHEIPSDMHVGIQGIHIRRESALLMNLAPVLSQLGYADIVGDVEYAYRYDPEKKDLKIQPIRVNVADMGNLEVVIGLRNLDLGLLRSVSSNPLSLIAMAPSVAISQISMKYQDGSAVRRFIQLGARQAGQSEEQYVAGIVDQIDVEKQKQKRPETRNGLTAIQDFIKKPGELDTVISPLEPVPLMRFVMMGDAEEMVNLLNISIRYRELK